MKKSKLLAVVLVLAMMLSLNIVVNAARAAGPFAAGAPDNVGSADAYAEFYEGGGLTAWDSLQPALDGRNFLANPVFVDGVEGFGGEDGEPVGSPDGEWSWNALVMSWDKLNADGDMRSSKYCGNDGMWDETGFFISWKYDQAYIADAFYLATGNDCTEWPRRMDDGWTFSGSNDGTNWTVLYTGQAEDYDPITYTWWRFDLPNNTELFQYYKVWAEGYYQDQDQNIIQLSVLAVSGNLPVAEAPPEEAAPPPAEAAPLPAPDPGVATPVTPTAPVTGDTAVIILLGAMVAAGVVIFKKKTAVK
ncbi:MAG: hypothetical protein FWD23_08690 [Oscillospiraceae bacterium]|nr:hypothetical protein [Oscillospiraceae bacterium]